MKWRLLLIGLCTLSASASAMQPVTPVGLLATEIARPLLEQDPAVVAARAGLDVALQEAGILDQSPYEWTARGAGLQRRLENGPHYNEWNLGIERGIRLAGKAAADRQLGKATVEEAKARYGEALHESARSLIALWLEWLGAEHAYTLAQLNLQATQASLEAVDKRLRAGDASRLDQSIARAELSEQKRLENDTKTQAAAAWARLSSRFPGIARLTPSLPVPVALQGDEAAWRARILEQSDELKITQTQLLKAQAHAERARADKTPDPTLGGYTASEQGGQERIYGVTLSVPIPGSVRAARSHKAVAEIEVARREVALKQRELETAIASEIATAHGALASLHLANEGAAYMQQNTALMQRAYSLGEAELQALLLARRQANSAALTALQAQIAALRAYYTLLVDAHLIWELDHD